MLFMVLWSIIGVLFLICVAMGRWSWKNSGSWFVQGYHNLGIDHTCLECRGTGYVPAQQPGMVTRCDECIDGVLPADPARFTRIPLALPGRRWWT